MKSNYFPWRFQFTSLQGLLSPSHNLLPKKSRPKISALKFASCYKKLEVGSVTTSQGALWFVQSSRYRKTPHDLPTVFCKASTSSSWWWWVLCFSRACTSSASWTFRSYCCFTWRNLATGSKVGKQKICSSSRIAQRKSPSLRWDCKPTTSSFEAHCLKFGPRGYITTTNQSGRIMFQLNEWRQQFAFALGFDSLSSVIETKTSCNRLNH